MDDAAIAKGSAKSASSHQFLRRLKPSCLLMQRTDVVLSLKASSSLELMANLCIHHRVRHTTHMPLLANNRDTHFQAPLDILHHQVTTLRLQQDLSLLATTHRLPTESMAQTELESVRVVSRILQLYHHLILPVLEAITTTILIQTLLELPLFPQLQALLTSLVHSRTIPGRPHSLFAALRPRMLHRTLRTVAPPHLQTHTLRLPTRPTQVTAISSQ
jgi:hypothetical protein